MESIVFIFKAQVFYLESKYEITTAMDTQVVTIKLRGFSKDIWLCIHN